MFCGVEIQMGKIIAEKVQEGVFLLLQQFDKELVMFNCMANNCVHDPWSRHASPQVEKEETERTRSDRRRRERPTAFAADIIINRVFSPSPPSSSTRVTFGGGGRDHQIPARLDSE